MNIEDKLKKVKKTLENDGYRVAYICLHGSQNYGLDIYNEDYESDFDMKAIVVPTLDDLIMNSKPVSKVYKTEWGQVDVKDIRVYMETLLKANPAYVETLYTPFYIVDDSFVDEVEEIRFRAEDLVKVLKAQFIRAMYGMMCEKQKALTHPYPTTEWKIKKWNYDGKQAHHCQRLWLMMQDYFDNGKELKDCWYPEQIEIGYLMGLKLNTYPFKMVEDDVKEIMQKAKEFKDKVLAETDESKIDYSIKDEMLKLSQDIIKKKIVSDIEK
jgi:predicted nucleotidyltransferase